MFRLIFLLSLLSVALGQQTPQITNLGQSTPQPSSSIILDSDLYTDYSKECPSGLAVNSFQYKLVSGQAQPKNGTGMPDASAQAKQDVQLKAYCSRHIDDNALTAALTSNKFNDTTIQCRFGETFSVDSAISETDSTKMCRPGEYIAGATSMYWNNNRLIKLKCCQVPNVLINDPNFGCYSVNVDDKFDGIRPVVKPAPGCPVDVLTGIGIVNGTGSNRLVGRYCSLSISGIDYSNTTCKQDRQREILQSEKGQRKPKSDQQIRESLPRVAPSGRTIPGSGFRVECGQSEAMSGMTATPYFFAVSSEPSDLVYTFTCSPIAGGNQTAVKKRFSPFTSLAFAEMDCYQKDSALCAVYSDFNAKTRERKISYACCEYSNILLSKADSDFQPFMLNGSSSLTSEATKPNEFIQRLVIQSSSPGSYFFKTSFSTFKYTSAPAFTDSGTTDIGMQKNGNGRSDISSVILFASFVAILGRMF